MNDRIGRVFQLLKQKWRHPLEREGEMTPEDREYRLFVDSHVALSRLRIAKKNPRTDSFISMKRLMKGQQSDRGSTVEVPPLPRRNADEAGTSRHTSISEPDDDDFSDILIAADQIADGMTEANCGSHAVVELYYLCGRPEVIKLNYTISDPSMKNARQPWQVFLDLLKRDYGKKLASGMMEKEKIRKREAEQNALLAEADENSNSNSGDAPTSSKASEKPAKVNRKRVAMHNPPMLPASVAADVAAAAAKKQFDIGLGRMQPRSKVRKVDEAKEKAKEALKQPENCAIIESEANDFMKQCKAMNQRGHKGCNGQFLETLNRDLHDEQIQAAANKNPFAVTEVSDYLKKNGCQAETQETSIAIETATSSSLRTPAHLQSPEPELHHEKPATSTMFGDVSGSSIHHWFPNFGNETNDFSMLSNNSNTFGHHLNATGKTLPEDVRHSYELMMQQNSVDYCRNFEQLLQSTQETPTKP
ncbi:hypothetical protein L596_024993 [Steinernema carpocapsae]|uniref:Uncharacterized protein n=1 Tax=Steinernema carpocapsae TaxID=34508 RepID=A0A4U5M6H2_STECR|nr:hypothetical protein L596_024993 [Steinernema carpocapsae]